MPRHAMVFKDMTPHPLDLANRPGLILRTGFDPDMVRKQRISPRQIDRKNKIRGGEPAKNKVMVKILEILRKSLKFF